MYAVKMITKPDIYLPDSPPMGTSSIGCFDASYITIPFGNHFFSGTKIYVFIFNGCKCPTNTTLLATQILYMDEKYYLG